MASTMEEHPDTVSRRASDPDSDPPFDRARLIRWASIAALPVAGIGVLALALGVPWWAVLIGIAVFILVLLLDT